MNSRPASSGSYFLSYSRSDETFALRLATDLRRRGIAMWVDQLDIRPSERWDRAIEQAVHECRGLVVVLSPRSVESDNVADEISFAIDNGKSVLPVMIERCRLPLRIARMQIIDAVGSYGRALEQCLNVLSSDAAACRGGSVAAQAGLSNSEAIVTAKAQLTNILGPIAGLLVDRDAARARTVRELYQLLGQHIRSEKDRERFLGLCGEPADDPSTASADAVTRGLSPVSPAEVERLGSLLVQYLGPISGAVARREAAAATTVAELQQRLARLIPTEDERANFLSKAEAP